MSQKASAYTTEESDEVSVVTPADLQMGKPTGEAMTKKCLFCRGPVNPHDLGTWKQIVCWMLNDRLSSASILQSTGVYAHNHCVNQAAEEVQERIDKAVEDAFEVLDEYHNRVCIGQNDGRCKCP